jgi:hypothetical protein
MAEPDPNPDDELDLEVDPPAETDLEDEGLDTAEQGDEVEDEPEEQLPVAAGGKDQGERATERQPSRSESRFRTLTEENKRKDQQLAETNRRIDALIAQQAPARTQGETPDQRAQRFSLMTPQEQIAETLRESEQRHNATLSAMQMQMLDTADRTAFHSKAASDPLYAKWAPRVEGKLAELRTKGTNVERDVLLKYMIGEAALERRSSKEGKAEVRQAARRVQAQRTRPTSSGSDTQAQRRTGSTAERRLENMQI